MVIPDDEPHIHHHAMSTAIFLPHGLVRLITYAFSSRLAPYTSKKYDEKAKSRTNREIRHQLTGTDL
jgi:hypothetical protein